MTDEIFKYFKEASELIIRSADALSQPIAEGIHMMSKALNQGNKILVCGNGGSAADAQHFASELMGRFELERNPLPSIALTTDTSFLTAVSNDYDFEQIFARQVQGLGTPGDILLVFSTSGNSKNILKAVKVAQLNGLQVIALTGRDGGEIHKALRTIDCGICVPHSRTAHIQDVHGMIVHCLCQGIESNYLSRGKSS